MGPVLRPLPGPSPKTRRGARPRWVPMSEVLLRCVVLPGGFPGSLYKFCKTLCVRACARLRQDRAGRELSLNVFSPFLRFPLLAGLGRSSVGQPFAPEMQPRPPPGWTAAPGGLLGCLCLGPPLESVDHALPR